MKSGMIFILFNIFIVLIALFLVFKVNGEYGKNLHGELWDAKQFGNKYVVSIKNHSDVVDALGDFVKSQKIKSGKILGLGAVNSATLRFFDPQTKQYVDKTFNEQMEISNLIGNISTKDGMEYLHIHITLGRSDYSTISGHLLNAKINGAGEFEVEMYPNAKINRKFQPETGLNIYDFEDK